MFTSTSWGLLLFLLAWDLLPLTSWDSVIHQPSEMNTLTMTLHDENAVKLMVLLGQVQALQLASEDFGKCSSLISQ